MNRQRRSERTTLMGARGLTPEGQALAEEIYARALAIRAAARSELSIAECVDIAAAHLGIFTDTETE